MNDLEEMMQSLKVLADGINECTENDESRKSEEFQEMLDRELPKVKFEQQTVETEMNQEIKKDAGKPQLTLVPTQIIEDIAYVRMFGIKKYPKESWKQVSLERYRDALFRHLLAYINDPQGVDEESGLPHLSHLACNVAFLCELEKENANGKGLD